MNAVVICVASYLLVDRVCPEDTVDEITYEETLVDTVVTKDCPNGAAGNITRVCELSGVWGAPVNYCGTKQKCFITFSANV